MRSVLETGLPKHRILGYRRRYRDDGSIDIIQSTPISWLVGLRKKTRGQADFRQQRFCQGNGGDRGLAKLG